MGRQFLYVEPKDKTRMLQVDSRCLDKFQRVKSLFYSRTKVPKENNWQLLTNNDIWLHIVAQVIVVGGSRPFDRFNANVELKDKVAYEYLSQLENEEKLRNTVNEVLCAIGARYASSDASKCKKTNALVHNLKMLKKYKDGPKGFLAGLLRFEGPDGDLRRIKSVMSSFMYT